MKYQRTKQEKNYLFDNQLKNLHPPVHPTQFFELIKERGSKWSGRETSSIMKEQARRI